MVVSLDISGCIVTSVFEMEDVVVAWSGTSLHREAEQSRRSGRVRDLIGVGLNWGGIVNW